MCDWFDDGIHGPESSDRNIEIKNIYITKKYYYYGNKEIELQKHNNGYYDDYGNFIDCNKYNNIQRGNLSEPQIKKVKKYKHNNIFNDGRKEMFYIFIIYCSFFIFGLVIISIF